MPKQRATRNGLLTVEEEDEPENTGAPDSMRAGARPGWRGRLGIPASAWAAALALNGFFLYLVVLDVIGVAPRTALTGAYYAMLGLALLVLAWRQRDVLRRRLAAPATAFRAYAVVAALLACWFLANVAFVSEGTLAKKLAAVLLTATIPTTLLLATLARPALERVALAMTLLGLVFVAAEAISLARTAGDEVKRFSPVAALDPITAAQIPALAAVACLFLRPRGRRGELLQAAAVSALAAGAVFPGSRGPLLALVVAATAAVALATRRVWLTVAPALVVGLALGFAGASAIGTDYYLTYSTPGLGPQEGVGAPGTPISTLSIRRQWWEAALRDAPERPLTGHGVAMFVDDTPEAHRMGIAGHRTYPHNSFVESAYSLGLPGVVLFLALVAIPAWALVRSLLAPGRARETAFALSLFLFALVASSLSGEIGADILLWSAGALAVGLYVEDR